MSWANLKGFNCRATLGYVTDGANEIFVSDAFGAYPQSKTIDGDTFNCGWETAPAHSRDRNSGLDARLAGAVYTLSASGISPVFRIDVPNAGDYGIQVAMGEASFASNAKYEVRDTTTALITLTETNIAQENYVDASLFERSSAANWVSAQVEVTKTVATTIFRFVIQEPAANHSALAHFAIKLITAAPASGKVIDYSKFPIEKLAAGPRSLLQ